MKLRSTRAKQHGNSGDMSLVDHLRELRKRVVISIVAMVIGTIIGFIWYQSAPPGMLTLGEIMREPYCALPSDIRVDIGNDGECRLLAIGPFEMFMLRLKVGAIAGLVLSSPVWLYQVWAFITPGLYKNERRYTIIFVSIAVVLFVIGAVLAYFVIAIGLQYLLTIGSEVQTTVLSGQRYFDFLLTLVVVFGVSFEIPLILIMLNILGFLEYRQVKDKRRVIWVIIFIVAALMSPGGDPFSMIALALSVGSLVEIAFFVCRFNDKRRGIPLEYIDDPDDETNDEVASKLDYQPEPIERPTKSTPKNFDDVL